jgi:hypothetical protein
MEEEEKYNIINHPAHYADKKIEVIDYIEDTLDFLGIAGYEAFCIGNVIRYVSRYTKKGKDIDLGKAEYYLKEAIRINKDK